MSTKALPHDFVDGLELEEARIMDQFSSTRAKGWTNALLISMGLWTAIVAGITLL